MTEFDQFKKKFPGCYIVEACRFFHCLVNHESGPHKWLDILTFDDTGRLRLRQHDCQSEWDAGFISCAVGTLPIPKKKYKDDVYLDCFLTEVRPCGCYYYLDTKTFENESVMCDGHANRMAGDINMSREMRLMR